MIVEYGPDIREVVRYMHLNPIRAGAVETLPEYEWSSHGQYAGIRDGGIADPEYVLKFFHDSSLMAVEKYEAYMADGSWKDKDGDRIGAYGGYILGSEDFVKRIKLLIKDKSISAEIANRTKLKNVYAHDEIIAATAAYYSQTIDEIIAGKGRWNRSKRILMYLLSRDAGISNTEIGKLLGGIHNSSIGRTIAGVVEETLRLMKTRQEINDISGRYLIKTV